MEGDKLSYTDNEKYVIYDYENRIIENDYLPPS